MITDGEITGRNFYFPETFEYAKWRVNTKLKDETIDDYRLFNNLMSSMPMAFNLFHPLMMLKASNPALLDKVLRSTFANITNIYKVTDIGLEFIPTPTERYTGDKSAMDAYIRFQDKAGNNFLIAIETKYTDSLGTNTASAKAFDKQLSIIRELDMFTEEGIEKITRKEIPISQIYRNFILAEKYGREHVLKDVFSVVLAPKDHPTTDAEINSLQQYLMPEYRYKITSLKLEDFTNSLRRGDLGEFHAWLDWFEDRYLGFENRLFVNLIST